MTLQNRVTPFGELEAVPARGTMLGNRGILHDGERRIGRARWITKRWLVCTLTFRGRKRTVMAPRRYTELFFLDEATFAAGHRPCRECRYKDYQRFMVAWRAATGLDPDSKLGADEVDAALHASRLAPDRRQARVEREISTLPDGTMFAFLGRPNEAWLLWKNAAHLWSQHGYVERVPATASLPVEVLTPARTVAVLSAGYVPQVHPSVTSSRGSPTRARS